MIQWGLSMIESDEIESFLCHNLDWREVRNHLDHSGVALLRGHFYTLGQFESFAGQGMTRFHQPATRIHARAGSVDGFTSRVAKDSRLLSHAEGYYRPCLSPPDVCLFWCQVAPAQGGETSWLDGAALFDALPPDLARRLESEGVVYEAWWSQERWQAEFDVCHAADLCRLLDSDHRCSYELSPVGDLHIFYKINPILVGIDGVKRFVNGMLAHLPEIRHPRCVDTVFNCKPTNKMHWGDGGLISNADVNRLLDAHDAVLNKHRWVDGDLLILDNHRLLHGREMMPVPGERVIYSRFGFWN